MTDNPTLERPPGDAVLRAIAELAGMARAGVAPGAISSACMETMALAVPGVVVRRREDQPPSEEEALVLTLAGNLPSAQELVVLREDGPVTEPEAERLRTIVATASAALTAGRALEESRIDHLTGVLNRAALRERLDEEVARARRDELGLACVVVDLDDFKTINDDLGHAVGDAHLRAAGAALSAAVRPFDHVGRIGGDEFAVILPGTTIDQADAAAHRIHEAVCRGDRFDPAGLLCSVGFASWTPGLGPWELLERADQATLEAKRSGGDRVVAAAAVDLDTCPDAPGSAALRSALRGDGMSVCFQPICGIEDGSLAGYEALTRGPSGLERPDRLLAAARDAGELVTLDERLHREAFRAAENQGLAAPLSLFVNIEPETLVRIIGDDRFWRRTTRSFASLSEVTERALLDRPGPLLRACQRLRELGWGIALDDVGEDPRALALLPLIAPDVIKLDMGLVQRTPSEVLATIVIGVNACVEATGARIVAEGVENAAHRDRAIAMGADFGQGWFFGRPSKELVSGTGHSPLPRTPPPRVALGVTPFQLVAATTNPRIADELLLHELQAEIERRAEGLGPVAVLATALGGVDGAALVERRMAERAERLGCVAILGAEIEDAGSRGRLHRHRLDRTDPLSDEWVTVVVCPYSTMVLAARRLDGEGHRWRFAISHERGVAHAVANQLLARLP